jgi:L-ascorbate metabolism protein UlaG (beta-lactamase superfamily)
MIAAFLEACTSLPPAPGTSYERSGLPLHVTSIGHATFLIEVGGRLVLTDPRFYENPLTGRHPDGLGLAPGRMPAPDVILVTHAHRDHFDRTFLQQLADKQVPVVVAMGMGQDLAALGFTRVIELEPWRSITLDGVVITAAPAVHHGPTNTYVIQAGGRSIYFASETVLFHGLSRVAERFAPIDVAFLPADGLKLRWGTPLAMDPGSAAEAVLILRPRVVIPVLDHDFSRSIAGLVVTTTGSVDDFKALATRQIPDAEVFVLKPGCRWRPAKGVACER